MVDEPEDTVHGYDLSPGDLAMMRDIAEVAAKETVKQMFVTMGLDPKQPIVSQRYFNVLREITENEEDDEHQADIAWTRRTRKMTDGVGGKALVIAMTVAVGGALHTFWIGLQKVIK